DPIEARFVDLVAFLEPGDLVVVNVSATIPAALDGRLSDGEPVAVHLSGTLPGDVSLVEVRRPHDCGTVPRRLEPAQRDGAHDIVLTGGGHARLLAPFAGSARLWLAALDVRPDLLDYLARFGRPIRYRHVTRDWPIGCYQTIFATEPGSAEM